MGAQATSIGQKLIGDIQKIKATAHGVRLAEMTTTTAREQIIPADELAGVRHAVDAKSGELRAVQNHHAQDAVEWLNATRHFLCVQERTQATLLRRAA